MLNMRIILLLSLVLIVSGCSQYIELDGFPGVYSDGVVTVSLNVDGTGAINNGYVIDSFYWYALDSGDTFITGYAIIYDGVLLTKKDYPDVLIFGSYRLYRN